jgi:hypothetical protein
MALREGNLHLKRLDLRKTAQPRTVKAILGYGYETPEDARRAWDSGEIRRALPSKVQRFLDRARDVVLIVAQREARANEGIVEILSIDLRRNHET